ncbi:MAG: hypothetical protein K5669_04685 [Lachnospiraceae bacterium]|nr:hypothetical protein [Lachnospiraceae bacterium]
MNNNNSLKTKSSVPGFYRFADTFGKWFFMCFCAFLLLTALLSTSYINDIMTQKVLFKWDNPIPNILVGAVFILGFSLLGKAFKSKSRLRNNLFLYVTLAWIFVSGVALAIFGRSVPAADAKSVFVMADMASKGDLSFITGSDSYLSFYPHQIGLVSFYTLPLYIWNKIGINISSLHIFKIVNCLLCCGAVLFQYHTIKNILKDKSYADYISVIYLILAGLNVPLIFYTSFVYGEIPAVFAISGSMYFLSRIISDLDSFTAKAFNKKILKTVLPKSLAFVFFSALSVFIRKNSMIFIIALSIVLVVEVIKSKRLFYILLLTVTVTCAINVLPLTVKIYENASGNKLLSGVTATSYFAMGMQESDRGCGYYNGFNINTYTESGFNTDLANEASRLAILERLDYFKSNPSYAFNFYLKKYLAQWSDGTYSVRQATWAESGGRRDIIQSIYTGDLGNAFVIYCNLYQFVIYLGCFLFFLKSVIKRKSGKSAYSFYILLGIIFTFGCFLFHMLWEANSRYIFPCSVFLMPYAAAGFASNFPMTIKSHKDK